MTHLLCTGGGTAGHVVPAIPIMRAFLDAGARVDFVGSGSTMERDLLADLDVTYHGIMAGKLRRYFSLENLLDAFRVLGGIFQALWLLGRLKPEVVFSKGGFVSFPVVFAAWCWRVPVVAHESDLSPGLANRLALPFVRTLCVSFPDTRVASFSGDLRYTGTPVRPELLAGDRERGRALLEADPGRPVVLVTGGSLGADRLNAIVRDALPGILEQAVLAHVCGAGKTVPSDAAGYQQFEYVREGWGDLLAAADLVISRAGANALYELLSLGKQNLLVPLPRAASRGDQIENAAWAEGQGFSRVIQEEALTPEGLTAAVAECLSADESGRIARFSPPDSVRLIVEAVQAAVDA
ncbi:MAG: UDP-N-acetylglucosamine--N-acetylmuramyl-(pentapeptide) pyrophosphoryl-undecaprenol N-acetylglucosamine transferase [Pseudomonadota bacterium]